MLWLDWEITSAILQHEIQTEKHFIQQSSVRVHTHKTKISASMLTQFQCRVND
jgi:hypothetical protein